MVQRPPRLLVRVHAEDVPLGQSGGIEGFVRGLIQGLSELSSVRIEVMVAPGEGDRWRDFLQVGASVSVNSVARVASPDTLPGIALLKRLLRGQSWAWTLRTWMRSRALRAPADETPAVDYFPFHRGATFGAVRAVTVHDLRAFDPEFGDKVSARLVAENIERASVVFTSWKNPERRIRELFPESAHKVVRVPFPLMHTAQALAKPPSVELKRPFLLFPAGIVPHKNHRLLINYASKYAEDMDFDFVLTGHAETDFAGTIISEMKSAGVRHRFHVLGFVNESELRWLYENCWALVMPSLYEAASGPIMEAMYFGKPILASKIDIFEDQMRESGGGAALFDPSSLSSLHQAIEKLRHCGADLARQSDQGAKWYASLTWARTAEAYAEAMCR